MKSVVVVDERVIAEVLAAVGMYRGDPDFEEILTFLRLRYLHYQRIAMIKGMSLDAFNRKIENILVANVRVQLATAFDMEAIEATTVLKQVYGRYHFLAQATPAEHQAAEKLIQALPQFDQEVYTLFLDGLTQIEVVKAMGLRTAEVQAVSQKVKMIYKQVES